MGERDQLHKLHQAVHALDKALATPVFESKMLLKGCLLLLAAARDRANDGGRFATAKLFERAAALLSGANGGEGEPPQDRLSAAKALVQQAHAASHVDDPH